LTQPRTYSRCRRHFRAGTVKAVDEKAAKQAVLSTFHIRPAYQQRIICIAPLLTSSRAAIASDNPHLPSPRTNKCAGADDLRKSASPRERPSVTEPQHVVMNLGLSSGPERSLCHELYLRPQRTRNYFRMPSGLIWSLMGPNQPSRSLRPLAPNGLRLLRTSRSVQCRPPSKPRRASATH
jgi:hypothetical protein